MQIRFTTIKVRTIIAIDQEKCRKVIESPNTMQIMWMKAKRLGTFKDYSERDIHDFEAIKEMKGFGLSLNDIQAIFGYKEAFGCGNKALLGKVINKLDRHKQFLVEKENQIKNQRQDLDDLIQSLFELEKGP